MPSKRRDHLVDVAFKLFYRHGFHATGIDTILAESGVAKMTLYKHFKSKDELILASLERYDQQWREWFVASVERRAKKPADRLLAIFDALAEFFHKEDYCGCPFVKATSEFPSLQDPIHQIAVEHKGMVHSYVRGLAGEAGAKDPGQLAEQLCLVLEGAIVTAQMTGQVEVARQARRAGEVLVKDGIADKM